MPAPSDADFDSVLSAQPRSSATEDGGSAVGTARRARPAEIDAQTPSSAAGIGIAGEEPTSIDRWWGRMLGSPLRQKLWYWGGPIAVTLLGAVLRLWNLGQPSALVFDETYYVKDAWTLLHLGYESGWPAEPDPAFNSGQVDGYNENGSFVVHPPLGKWIIASGLAVFGAQDGLGWRISTALVGILAIFVLAMIARTLTRSTLLATIAGGLFAIDGHAIVMARTALLDNSVMFLCLLGFWAVLLDRGHSANRLAEWMSRRTATGRSTDWGPALWWRPWLLAAGLAFGLASAVKWNGLYFLAFFALYTLVVDALARRRAGVTFWWSGTLFRQAPASFLLTVPIALVAYLVTWTGWFVSEGGYYRHYADDEVYQAKGFFSWVPALVQSFWHYQQGVYQYHVGENSPHGYAANPLGWLLMLRPTAFYYVGQGQGESGCTAVGGCAQYITSIANPIIWWAAVAACGYLLYRLIRRREWQVGLVLMGIAAGYLPWLLYTGRTVFQFYTIAFEPYLILGLVIVIGLILGRPGDPAWRRLSGIRLIAVFVGLCTLVSAFFYPIWTGMQVPVPFVQLHYWLPSWR
ncbi:phospholipid carrier-dependent glycosyltransferase [soil metagenome]